MGDGAPRRFFWQGRVHVSRDGDTLLTALARDGLPPFARSIRYHRPRGPTCGVGFCTGCLVRWNGAPGVRACRQPVEAGARAEPGSGWPSARFDVLGGLDRLLPHGVDTLHGFRRPAFATPAFQWVVRRLAGYGPVPTDPAPPPVPARTVDAEVVIVGAGRSGRAAAERLVAHGRRPLLIDRGLSVPELPGADLLARTTVTFLPPPRPDGPRPFRLVGFEEPARAVSLTAGAVVLATGGYDAALLFGANDLPGVFTADGALALREPGRRPAFRRAVVFGGGERARAVLDAVGDRVVAVVAPGEIRPEVVRRASEGGVPLYPRTLVVRARGRSRVRAVDLRPRGGGPAFPLTADALVLAHRRLPHPQLLFQAGARMAWRAGTGAYYPVLEDGVRTSVPGLWAVGSTAGFVGEASPASGLAAAEHLLGGGASDADLARVEEGGLSDLEGYYRELLREPLGPRPFACACEDVLLEEVRAAHARGYRGVEVVKRYTGLGTGLCQGRYCLPDALLLLAILEGRPPAEVGFITQRPPVVPTPLGALATLPAPAEAAP